MRDSWVFFLSNFLIITWRPTVVPLLHNVSVSGAPFAVMEKMRLASIFLPHQHLFNPHNENEMEMRLCKSFLPWVFKPRLHRCSMSCTGDLDNDLMALCCWWVFGNSYKSDPLLPPAPPPPLAPLAPPPALSSGAKLWASPSILQCTKCTQRTLSFVRCHRKDGCLRCSAMQAKLVNSYY